MFIQSVSFSLDNCNAKNKNNKVLTFEAIKFKKSDLEYSNWFFNLIKTYCKDTKVENLSKETDFDRRTYNEFVKIQVNKLKGKLNQVWGRILKNKSAEEYIFSSNDRARLQTREEDCYVLRKKILNKEPYTEIESEIDYPNGAYSSRNEYSIAKNADSDDTPRGNNNNNNDDSGSRSFGHTSEDFLPLY